MKSTYLIIVAVLIFALPPAAPAADNIEQIDFDIYTEDGFIIVWANLSTLITSKRVAQMREGIDMAVQYHLSLLRPRRIWGAEKTAEVDGVLQIGFRLITEDFFVSDPSEPALPAPHFLSLGQLHKYLADSVQLKLAEVDSLDGDKRYYIELSLTCISLTTFNVADTEGKGESDQSAIKWLFKEFLSLTNFGRQDYRVESRLFSLTELSNGH